MKDENKDIASRLDEEVNDAKFGDETERSGRVDPSGDSEEKEFGSAPGDSFDDPEYIDPDEFNDLEDDEEDFEDTESVENILAQEGLAVDDPVRMYLKDIGKVPLLSAEKETQLAERMMARGCSSLT